MSVITFAIEASKLAIMAIILWFVCEAVANAAGSEAGMSGADRPDRDPGVNPDGTRRRTAGIGASIGRPACATEYRGTGEALKRTSACLALSRRNLAALAEKSGSKRDTR
jgi:hypothetical protein